MIFAVLIAALMLSYFFRTALAVVAPEVAASLRLDPAALGTVSAGWFIGIAAAQLPVGIALDRWGPRRTMALGMLPAVAGAALFAVSDGFAAAFAGQLLIGIGCSPIFMGGLYVLARWFAPHRFATLSAILLAAGGLGNLLAANPLGHAAGAIGWRAVFGLTAAATALAVLAVWAVIGDRPPRAAPQDTPPETLRDALAGLVTVMRLRPLWPLLPLLAVGSATLFALRSLWGGPYLADQFGLDRIARGDVLSGMALAMVAGAALFGPLAARCGRYRPVLAVAGIGTILPLVLLAAAPASGIGIATLCFVTIGLFGNSYGVLMSLGRAFIPATLVGRGVTVLNLCSFLGTALCQTASGWIVASGGYAALFGTLAAMATVALAGLFLFAREPA